MPKILNKMHIRILQGQENQKSIVSVNLKQKYSLNYFWEKKNKQIFCVQFHKMKINLLKIWILFNN